jgi:hypothetical protein
MFSIGLRCLVYEEFFRLPPSTYFTIWNKERLAGFNPIVLFRGLHGQIRFYALYLGTAWNTLSVILTALLPFCRGGRLRYNLDADIIVDASS